MRDSDPSRAYLVRMLAFDRLRATRNSLTANWTASSAYVPASTAMIAPVSAIIPAVSIANLMAGFPLVIMALLGVPIFLLVLKRATVAKKTLIPG